MTDTNERLLEEYLQLPDKLAAVVAGLDEAGLDLTLGTGWSIREYACHVLEGESLWQLNLRILAAHDGVDFPMTWYLALTQDEWAARWGYGKRSLAVILDSYRASTCYLVEFLRNVPDAWEHAGQITWPGHGEPTRYSVRQIVEMNLRHLDGHVKDIRAIREMHGR